MARLYARWRPVSLRLAATSGAATVVSGSYYVAWTAEAEHRLPNASALHWVAATPGARVVPVHGSAALPIPSQTSQRWLMTDADQADESAHGTIVVVLASPLSNITGGVVVTLTLSWTVDFSMPIMETESPVPPSSATCATAGYPYYVSWLEHVGRFQLCHGKRGGVPATNPAIFAHGIERRVYIFDPAAKLNMKVWQDIDGKRVWNDAPVTHGVVLKVADTIANTDKVMFVFPDITSATRCANGGSPSDAFPIDPGVDDTDYCTLPNPEWTLVGPPDVSTNAVFLRYA